MSVPVLLNAQCYERQPPSTHKQFLELCSAREGTKTEVPAKGIGGAAARERARDS